ncbi:hypothetical protein B0A48_08931 [Cryoendolithus antarcticus]|uniref:Heterokaryon incompatibility domain-containing protein n=1 Tax=Cryoendolithus antarcticus TaxID=1507870 RepID=A0A1V8T590_9PEZI|nr:hypothetical protein B0A48_08931 [Cryoendolithus antarcticus]
MWLLNTTSRKLEFANLSKHDRYAILSHTWGEDEVLFDDIHERKAKSMTGYFACKQALVDKLQYIWIDTCCIDKRSSAELSEAINSMYRWYGNSQICYVYMDDIDASTLTYDSGRRKETCQDLRRLLPRSRWFTRGWTLQELLAPAHVHLYDASWSMLGSKTDLRSELFQITRIPEEILQDRDLVTSASVAQRMSWASVRKTSRAEDEAYALLGLFGVTMPLLYGEGRKAFLRLQEEIIRSFESEKIDHSVLLSSTKSLNLFALRPDSFGLAYNVLSFPDPLYSDFDLTRQGLRLTLSLRNEDDLDVNLQEQANLNDNAHSHCVLAMLNCSFQDSTTWRVALRLRRRPRITTFEQLNAHHRRLDVYDRLPGTHGVGLGQFPEFVPEDLVLARRPFMWPPVKHDGISIATVSSFLVAWRWPTSAGAWRFIEPDGCTYLRGDNLFSDESIDENGDCNVLLLLEQATDVDIKEVTVIKLKMERVTTPPMLWVGTADGTHAIALRRFAGYKGDSWSPLYAELEATMVVRADIRQTLCVAGQPVLYMTARFVFEAGLLWWHVDFEAMVHP